jgi:hypothetical protein
LAVVFLFVVGAGSGVFVKYPARSIRVSGYVWARGGKRFARGAKAHISESRYGYPILWLTKSMMKITSEIRTVPVKFKLDQ